MVKNRLILEIPGGANAQLNAQLAIPLIPLTPRKKLKYTRNIASTLKRQNNHQVAITTFNKKIILECNFYSSEPV